MQQRKEPNSFTTTKQQFKQLSFIHIRTQRIKIRLLTTINKKRILLRQHPQETEMDLQPREVMVQAQRGVEVESTTRYGELRKW